MKITAVCFSLMLVVSSFLTPGCAGDPISGGFSVKDVYIKDGNRIVAEGSNFGATEPKVTLVSEDGKNSYSLFVVNFSTVAITALLPDALVPGNYTMFASTANGVFEVTLVGLKGDKGEKGDPGQTGETGEKGDPGENGAPGTPGKDGSSCTVKDNGDGTKTISCTDGTTVTVSDGKNGEPGTPGKDGVCAGNVAPVIESVDLETPYLGEAFLLTVKTKAQAGKTFVYLVVGSGAAITQSKTDEAVFTVTVQNAGSYCFGTIVSDGCQTAVKSFCFETVDPWKKVGYQTLPKVAWVSAAAGDGQPALAYRDDYSAGSVRVYRHDGLIWQEYNGPQPGFKTTYVSLAYDGNKPCLAFSNDTENAGKAMVVRYNFDTVSWDVLGADLSKGRADYVSLKINNGVPFVAFTDNGRGGIPVLKKYVSETWQEIGSFQGPPMDQIGNLSQAFDLNGNPYVAFDYMSPEGGFRVMVYKYNGEQWVPVGHGEGPVCEYESTNSSIAVVGDAPYVAYNEYPYVVVRTFDGDDWRYVGTPIKTEMGADNVSLVANGSDLLLSYRGSSDKKPVVKKLVAGEWVDMKLTGLVKGEVDYLSLAAQGDLIFTVFQDKSKGDQGLVMKYH